MVVAVRTEDAEGGLVVVKEARSDGDVARLTREAALLARCRHPGVVDLLAVGERSITLRHAGTAIARLGPFPLDQVAGIVCAVADVVQALHRLGVVHGDVNADHVLLDDRGRPRLCGFAVAADHTPDGAADDVAAIGRLLAALLKAGAELTWANPPRGLHRRAEQRQARRHLDAIAAQATRDQREQRPTARQLAKAVHAAVPGCSLPRPSAAPAVARPAFAEIPADLDPTADLGWTADDLSWLASEAAGGTDLRLDEDTGGYDDLRALAALPLHDAAEDWADLAANPEAVTGPVPVLEIGDEQPVERARIDTTQLPGPTPGPAPSVPLPPGPEARPPRRRVPLASAVVLAVVLVLGIVAGVAGARSVHPFGDDEPPPAPGDLGAPAGSEQYEAPESGPAAPAGAAPEDAAAAWPDTCDVPSPPGPDVDDDGCPDTVAIDGRTATVGSVSVVLGQEGDQVALGDWDCDGTATPALLRPGTGEVFVFPRWSFADPLEIEATAVVAGAESITAGGGGCPDIVVRTRGGERTVAVAP